MSKNHQFCSQDERNNSKNSLSKFSHDYSQDERNISKRRTLRANSHKEINFVPHIFCAPLVHKALGILLSSLPPFYKAMQVHSTYNLAYYFLFKSSVDVLHCQCLLSVCAVEFLSDPSPIIGYACQ